MRIHKLQSNTRHSDEQRKAYFENSKPGDRREQVPLDELQFAVDRNWDGHISQNEWLHDSGDVFRAQENGSELYLGAKPGLVGSILGKKPDFHRASGWVEVPDSGPVRYETKMLKSLDQQNQTAEIATLFSMPFLGDPLYV